jgi:hypothetical protein
MAWPRQGLLHCLHIENCHLPQCLGASDVAQHAEGPVSAKQNRGSCSSSVTLLAQDSIKILAGPGIAC